MSKPPTIIIWKGQRLTVEQAAAQSGISASTIRRRLREGLTMEAIVDSIDDRYRRWGKTPVDKYEDLDAAIAQGRYKPKELYYWQVR